MTSLPRSQTPTRQILEYLQRHGSATIKALEQHLGVTTNAVRQHLTTLSSEGYIAHQRVSTGVGRPHHAYSLTERAHDLFACHCDDLALTLLEEVFAMEGVEATQRLLGKVGDRLAAKYAPSVQSTVLRERVDELAGTLNARGVLTDVEAESEEDAVDEQIVLKTYNCPFHELAHEHREICTMDKQMLEKVVGTGLELQTNIMDGHNCCSFVVAVPQKKAETLSSG